MEEKVRNRDSNMELLRCVAMLLVCLFHVDFISFNFPHDQLHIATQPISAYLKICAATLTYTCVDIFVLLSGWYGIHVKKKRLAEFIFQVLAFSLSIYAVMLLFDKSVTFKWQFFVRILTTDDYWFIPAYLSLYVFSPVLNSFIEKSGKRTFLIVVAGALALQSVFGWISPNEEGYLEGRSPFSFFILYMLARYVHIYADRLKKIGKPQLCAIFLIIICSESAILFHAYQHYQQTIIDTIFKFSSLFTIAASLCVLLFFYHLKIKSNVINWAGRSAFAVFLLHCFPYFNDDIYQFVLRTIYLQHSGMAYAMCVAAFIATIYIGALLLDQIRIFVWDKVLKIY